MAARAGATLAELQARLGHSTATAAMRYQHASSDRDAEIARRLSTMAGAE
jgi:integrase